MSTAVAGKGLRELLQPTPASAGSMATQACWPTAGSTSTNWRSTRTLRKRLTCCGMESCPRRRSWRSLRRQLAARAGVGLRRSWRCCVPSRRAATPMEVLRTAVSALSFYDPDEKAVDHNCECAQIVRSDGADCHAGGGIRSDSQRQGCGRAGCEAFATPGIFCGC